MDISPSAYGLASSRIVIIGCNSVLWSRIAERVLVKRPDTLAVSHRDIAKLQLGKEDIVWIFSYSADAAANHQLFEQIATSHAGTHIYVSSATANLADRITCYRYPAVKRDGEKSAARILHATTMRIGLIYDDLSELPSGTNAATRLDDLVKTMTEQGETLSATGETIFHFEMVDRPFGSRAERATYRLYGVLIRRCGSRPCLLRPIDLLLRIIGWRWYGYFRLSNELCCSTT
jgi:hypothetical protein